MLDILKENSIKELNICGMMSHMCVDTTTREAFDLGFKCKIVHDACITRALEFNGRIVIAEDVHATRIVVLSMSRGQSVDWNKFTGYKKMLYTKNIKTELKLPIVCSDFNNEVIQDHEMLKVLKKN